MSEIEVEEYYQSNKKEIDEYWLANKKPLLDNEEKDYFNEYYKKYYRTESAPVEVTLEIVKIYEKGCERYWKAHKIDIIKEYYQQSQDDAEGFLPDELFF
jgi:predicted lipase